MALHNGEVLELSDLSAELGLDGRHFTVQATLSGGMGDCLKIVHRSSGKTYALKALEVPIHDG